MSISAEEECAQHVIHTMNSNNPRLFVACYCLSTICRKTIRNPSNLVLGKFLRIIDSLDYINLTALHLYVPLRFRFLIMRALLIFVPLLQRACIASLQQDCQIVITPKGLRKQNRQILRF